MTNAADDVSKGHAGRGWSRAATVFKIGMSYVIGACALAFVLHAAWTQGEADYRTLQVLLCILAGVLGWILGLYFTPASDSEKKDFSEYGKGLATLLSGFSLGKIDSLSEMVRNGHAGISTSQIVLWLLLFLSSFLIAALFTYISRLYVRDAADEVVKQRDAAYAQINTALEKLRYLR
ncbi:hypothetical protein ACSFA2_25175 [Variovorax sp. LT2P21]|uniref:hypothetical protein n=1 Tax=Variovorax sp. LT2P21 TaxID=3443731 RepID=UPI003F46BA7E